MIIGIIQARMGSKRLPGKSMLDLSGKPLVYRVIERVKKAELLDRVVLATTEKADDDVLCEVARELEIDCFRGDENDLISRFYNCALNYNADVVVRVCADNPFIDPYEIDRIVEYYLLNAVKGKLFSNTHNIDNNGYPDGLGAEVYDMQTLKWLFENIKDPEMREHVHKYFYDNDLVRTIQCPINVDYTIKLDVNTLKEYEYIKALYERFGDNFKTLDYIRGMA